MTVSDTSTHANPADALPPGVSQRPYRPRLEENAGRLVDQRIGGTKRQEGLQARYRRNEARTDLPESSPRSGRSLASTFPTMRETPQRGRRLPSIPP